MQALAGTSLARQTVRSAVWSITAGFASRAIGLIGTLVITRFIAPAEYGEVTIAAVMVLTASQVSTLGFGQYLIATPSAGREVAFHATVYHVVLGAIVLGLLFWLGRPLGPLLDAPAAARFLPGLIVSGLLDRIYYIPERILVRDMRFGIVSAERTAGDVAYTVGSLWLALLGWGGMAIVIGNVARSLIRTAIVCVAANWRDWVSTGPIKWSVTRQLFWFGLPISGAALASFAARRWDNFFVAKFFGPSTTGMYNLAYNLADVPAMQIGEQVGDVLVPSFARMDAERRKTALVRSITLLGLVVFPLAVGLGAVAHTLVAVLFDPRWQPVAPMLVLLSALSVTRPVGWVVASYLQARHLPRALMWLELFKLVVLLAAIVTIGRGSALWTCAAVGFGFAVHMLACLWVIKKSDGIPLRSLLTSVSAPLIACVPLALSVLGARHLVMALGGLPPLPLLVLEIVIGALVYIGAALVFAREASRELVARVRDALQRRSGRPAT
ncbi:MAG TPA: oligosaccharide flippase family protein [Polyangiaceae bacterium]|nr:oligosaccharide flippase family protein [Polyangiaceae bacterium]